MEVLSKGYLVPLKNRNRIRINFFKGLFLDYYNFSKGLLW
ncbi:hypothetical protein HMPREF9124_0314 [Oribacterium sp. oral taxon 108 str. F0425]|nr:hypothetical protein HMPREF9124_0314 [Oribacterium sp. oral taxon 108 str. F0425]